MRPMAMQMKRNVAVLMALLALSAAAAAAAAATAETIEVTEGDGDDEIADAGVQGVDEPRNEIAPDTPPRQHDACCGGGGKTRRFSLLGNSILKDFQHMDIIQRTWSDLFSDRLSPFTRIFELMERISEDQSTEAVAHVGDDRPVYSKLSLITRDTSPGWLVTTAMPGVPKQNVTIEVSPNGVLSIEGRYRKSYGTEGNENVSTIVLLGSVQLPYGVDSGSISASYENGLLEVIVPHVRSEEQTLIDIQ